jgi:hypothetical protein
MALEKALYSIFFSKGVTDEEGVSAFGRRFNTGRRGMGP